MIIALACAVQPFSGADLLKELRMFPKKVLCLDYTDM